jgi:uncharacterized protein (TIGR02145 family)
MSGCDIADISTGDDSNQISSPVTEHTDTDTNTNNPVINTETDTDTDKPTVNVGDDTNTGKPVVVKPDTGADKPDVNTSTDMGTDTNTGKPVVVKPDTGTDKPDINTSTDMGTDTDKPDVNTDTDMGTDTNKPDVNTDTDTDMGKDSSNIIYKKLSEDIYINEKDNVAIYINRDLNKSEKLIYNNDKIAQITKDLYSKFEDKYDFIFLVTNNKERPKSVTYSGVAMKVKNDVNGIGASLYDHTTRYGSNGKLKSVMHFAYRKAITQGPTLHELLHYWANKFNFDYAEAPYYRLGSGGHWGRTGFFGGKGQIGGYKAQTFKDENLEYQGRKSNYKIYSAQYFGWNANGGNSIPYNDVELYLMGMIPLSDVKDILLPIPYATDISHEDVAKNNPDVDVDRSRKYFMVPFEKKDGTPYQNAGVTRKSLADILSENNIPQREPNYKNSQKDFKVLTVLLDTKMPSRYDVDVVSARVESLTFAGDDHNDRSYNFWEATRGKGTLNADNIDKALKGNYSEYIIDDNFATKTITYKGKEYKTVKSPYTGKVWLDRNLGADRICQSFSDKGCYGYLFQFGREFDGHQERNSPITRTRKDTITNNDNTYVVVGNSGALDWVVDGVDSDKSQRVAFMKNSDGNGICPQGFRVPTLDEISAETKYNEQGISFPGNSINDNFLKLPLAGYRNAQSQNGTITEEGQRGAYWTSSPSPRDDGSVAIRYIFFSQDAFLNYGTYYVFNGESVRCIHQ